MTFQASGGSAVDSMSVLNGKTIVKPTDPTREGYIFIGWYSDEQHESPFLFGTELITADTVLYARWVESISGLTERTIDFDLRYDNAPEIPSVKTKGGKLYNVPTPERVGYTFNGWWISSCENPAKLSYVLTDNTQFRKIQRFMLYGRKAVRRVCLCPWCM